MNTGINKLIKHLQEIFDGDPWYGDNIMKKLSAIDATAANWHPGNGAHSIAQLVKHMINWKRLVNEKLRDNSLHDIEMNSQEDWNTDLSIVSEEEWQQLINEFIATQQELIVLLTARTDERMLQAVSNRNYNMAFLTHGIYEHDIYHLGQIGYVQGMYQRKNR